MYSPPLINTPAGDVGRVGDEEGNDARHLLRRRATASARRSREDLLRDRRDHLRRDEARRDAVYGDADRAFERHRHRDPNSPAFAAAYSPGRCFRLMITELMFTCARSHGRSCVATPRDM
jgi:hypothetical protein